jgi:methylthioribose-1-phosphate isomerase
MQVNGKPMRSIWFESNQVHIIDQRRLPHFLETLVLHNWETAADAIREMAVRGAPLIGVTAAWGLYLAAREARQSGKGLPFLLQAADSLRLTRPTAVNLAWAIDQVVARIREADNDEARETQCLQMAQQLTEDDVRTCEAIGMAGLPLIQQLSESKNRVVNIMTHCNAGWLACVDHGTATSPMYKAHTSGIPIHVWVSETRPRLQGALTAWELNQAGIPHTLIPDNAAGHLMQKGMVDLVITGCDRAAANGDAANKIGTYLKAIAAKENGIPFYVALPRSTFDLQLRDGVRDIPIEQRSQNEVLAVTGMENSASHTVSLFADGSPAANYGFDVTPARYITGFITERGVSPAKESAIQKLFQ